MCYRGKCIQTTVYLQNVGTRKCLIGERFSVNDKAVVRNCEENPIESLTILRPRPNSRTAICVGMSYTTQNNTESYKALTVIQNGNHNLTVRFVQAKVDVRIIWHMERLELNSSEFLLTQDTYGVCAKVAENGYDVELTQTCWVGDPMNRWKLVWPEGRIDSQFYTDYTYLYITLICAIGTLIGAYIIVWAMKRWIFIKSGKKLKNKKLRMKTGLGKANKKQEKNANSKFRPKIIM